ncbi:30S ribosomal protein S14 [Candidatus Marsarchaeota archaeon]|jgi:ribosomal protein S14|nr:30S ribosomal protein S14 [Candidatus Marsarchaeota archaeon]
MQVRFEERFKGKGIRKCRMCGNVRGLIRAHNLYICRKCFRDNAVGLGFKKYG